MNVEDEAFIRDMALTRSTDALKRGGEVSCIWTLIVEAALFL